MADDDVSVCNDLAIALATSFVALAYIWANMHLVRTRFGFGVLTENEISFERYIAETPSSLVYDIYLAMNNNAQHPMVPQYDYTTIEISQDPHLPNQVDQVDTAVLDHEEKSSNMPHSGRKMLNRLRLIFSSAFKALSSGVLTLLNTFDLTFRSIFRWLHIGRGVLWASNILLWMGFILLLLDFGEDGAIRKSSVRHALENAKQNRKDIEMILAIGPGLIEGAKIGFEKQESNLESLRYYHSCLLENNEEATTRLERKFALLVIANQKQQAEILHLRQQCRQNKQESVKNAAIMKQDKVDLVEAIKNFEISHVKVSSGFAARCGELAKDDLQGHVKALLQSISGWFYVHGQQMSRTTQPPIVAPVPASYGYGARSQMFQSQEFTPAPSPVAFGVHNQAPAGSRFLPNVNASQFRPMIPLPGPPSRPRPDHDNMHDDYPELRRR